MRCRRNRVRTVVVLLGVSGVLLLACTCAGGAIGLAIGGLAIGAGVTVVVVGLVAGLGSGRLVLRAMQARPVSEAEQPRLCAIVRELATVLRQPIPAVYVSPASTPNAFTAGKTPRRAAICVTEGLLRRVDEGELRAVVGHELGHIANRDILLTSVASAVAAMIVGAARMAWLLPGRRRAARHPLGGLLLFVLAPAAALVVRLAIHRSREYEADLAAARITGDPAALARALRTIESGARSDPLPPEPRLRASAALMIADPYGGRAVARFFSPHPPAADRIARLERLAGH